MRNRGIGRGRMFVGGFLLFAAVIVWGTGLFTTPHGQSADGGTEHVRTVVALYLRNVAIATILLSAISGWLLFPARRPRAPARDWGIGLLVALLVGTSIYQLLWLKMAVLS